MPRLLKPTIVVASLAPLALDAWAFTHHHLGPEPFKALIRDTGEWSLWFLAFTLVLTPVRRIAGLSSLAPLRRTLGLWAFFYASIHTLAYVVFDRFAGLDLSRSVPAIAVALTVSTARDVWDKPFLLIGAGAFIAMVPLAVTSTNAMSRWLGGRRWRMLHRLVYAVAIASLLHHWWPLPDRFQVIDRFGLVIVGALGFRVAWAWMRRQAATSVPARLLMATSSLRTVFAGIARTTSSRM